MRLMRVCHKNHEQANELAAKLGGRWASENVLATEIQDHHPVVPLNVLVMLELGGYLLASPDDVQNGLRSIMKMPNLSLRAPPGRRKVLFIDKPGAAKFQEVVFADTITTLGVARRPFKVLNFDVRGLNEREISAIGCLILRNYLRIYLPQLIRALRTGFLRGQISYERLLKSAEDYGDKFVIAAIRLAWRGFKSKRFKQRSLKVGETVRYYYDGASLGEVVGKYVAGVVQSFSLGTVNLANGMCFEYNETLGIAGVWPMEY